MSFENGCHRLFNGVTFCSEHDGRRVVVGKANVCPLCGAVVEVSNMSLRRRSKTIAVRAKASKLAKRDVAAAKLAGAPR